MSLLWVGGHWRAACVVMYVSTIAGTFDATEASGEASLVLDMLIPGASSAAAKLYVAYVLCRDFCLLE